MRSVTSPPPPLRELDCKHVGPDLPCDVVMYLNQSTRRWPDGGQIGTLNAHVHSSAVVLILHRNRTCAPVSIHIHSPLSKRPLATQEDAAPSQRLTQFSVVLLGTYLPCP